MKIIAHRGASARAPENTLAAVRLARKLRADGVEVDVHLTRDGQLAVIHDADTRRLAPGQPVRRVATSTLAELQKLDMGSWKHKNFSGEHIPSLHEVIAALGPRQEIFIEVKARETKKVLAALDRLLSPPKARGFPAERVVVMSFHDGLARMIKKARPAWRVLRLLYTKPSAKWLARFLRDVKAGPLNGIGQNRAWKLSKNDYAKLRATGANLSVWTVDDPVEARAWHTRGFHYLTSNVPEKMKRLG